MRTILSVKNNRRAKDSSETRDHGGNTHTPDFAIKIRGTEETSKKAQTFCIKTWFFHTVIHRFYIATPRCCIIKYIWSWMHSAFIWWVIVMQLTSSYIFCLLGLWCWDADQTHFSVNRFMERKFSTPKVYADPPKFIYMLQQKINMWQVNRRPKCRCCLALEINSLYFMITRKLARIVLRISKQSTRTSNAAFDCVSFRKLEALSGNCWNEWFECEDFEIELGKQQTFINHNLFHNHRRVHERRLICLRIAKFQEASTLTKQSAKYRPPALCRSVSVGARPQTHPKQSHFR